MVILMLAYRVTWGRKLFFPRTCDSYCDFRDSHKCLPCVSGHMQIDCMRVWRNRATSRVAIRRQNSPKATTGIQGLRTGHEEEYFSEEHRMQTGKATTGHYTSDPPGRTLCSSWVELLGQEGRLVSSEAAARSESLADLQAGGTPGGPVGVSIPPGGAHNSSWAT